MKDQILFTPIDYVGSDSRAIEFGGELSDRLVETQALIERFKLHIKLSLRTAVNSSAVSPEAKEEFHKGLRKIADAGIDFWVDMYGSSPTRKMYGVLFDQGAIASGVSAIATSDLDQYPPEKNLDRVMLLHERVKTYGALLGVGSRDVPVVLAANPENAHLRRIFEGIINLTIRTRYGPYEVISTEHVGTPDSAYQFHGDYVTGVYMFNPTQKYSERFVRNLVEEARAHEFSGFEDEYLMMLEVLYHGNLAVEHFRSLPNPFSPCDPAEERNKIIERQIKAPLRKLAKTRNARDKIKGSIHEGNARRLNPYYTNDQIGEVVQLMLQALA